MKCRGCGHNPRLIRIWPEERFCPVFCSLLENYSVFDLKTRHCEPYMSGKTLWNSTREAAALNRTVPKGGPRYPPYEKHT